MATLTPGSNENIYQLLSQHNFTSINQNIDKYKCKICQRVLINAYQAVYGCNYCEKCVDGQVRNGVVFCPGDTEECKTSNLSSVAINYGKNKEIIRLVVKCPEEMCCYESELRNMGDHLRLCGTSVECPFTDFGCDQGKLKRDELNEHLQQESYRHSEILIDVMGNLRNELAELMKSDLEKGTIIKSLREEIESIKLEKAVLEQRMNNLSNIFDVKADKTVLEIEAKLEEMRREWRGSMEQQQLALANIKERNGVKFRTKIAERIDSAEKCLAEKIDVDFVWKINNIAEKRQKWQWIDSEYFKGCAEPYTMQLSCFFNGIELLIRFYIYGGDSDESLHWPFDRNVTIAITNQKRPNAHKTKTNHCAIAKPSNNSYQMSDPFKFQWNDLSNEGLLHDNRFTVQCFIRHG